MPKGQTKAVVKPAPVKKSPVKKPQAKVVASKTIAKKAVTKKAVQNKKQPSKKKMDLDDEPEDDESEFSEVDEDDEDFDEEELVDEDEESDAEEEDFDEDEDDYDTKKKGKKGAKAKAKPAKKAPSKSAKRRGSCDEMNEEYKPVAKVSGYKPSGDNIFQKDDWDLKRDSPFTKGQHVPFFFLCQGYENLASISGKNSMERRKEVMLRIYRAVQENKPDELADVFLFSTVRMESEYLQGDLGVGPEILKRAVGRVIGEEGDLKAAISKAGDIGVLCESKMKKPDPKEGHNAVTNG